ncbi:MAG: FAD-dependent oxidoreductase [Acutalibacteraceae bacterium]
MKSVWQTEKEHPQFKTLKGEKTTDVLIIGGGITGILCANALKNAGVDYMLLEGKRILTGNTANTTAKITAGHSLIYDKMIKKYGLDIAKKYYFSSTYAIDAFRALSRKYDCDFQEKDLYIYSLKNKDKITKEVRALREIGADCNYEVDLEIPLKAVGAVKYHNQAQFNPLKLLYALANDLNIYENSFVKKIKGYTAICENGAVTAKKIIFASHFPLVNTHGLYFLKMYQHRSFVLALENAKQYEGMYVDEDKKGLSFRNYDDYLLISGGARRTGKNEGGFETVKSFAKMHYPKAKERFRFAAQDCITLDNIPYIGRYSYTKPDFFVATGFNKWGMTSAMVASELLCDMVIGKKNNLEKVFCPQRSILTLRLFANAFSAAKNLATPSVPRCTHMGCALKWNSDEHTWDCPCHGSRYDKEGRILENPAKRNKSSL